MTNVHKTPRTLNIILWTVQILLAVSLIWAAGMKLFQPSAKLAEMWPWTAEHPQLVKFTGILDLLAAIGLILPGILGKHPRLTILAAYGTIALMIAASIFHISRGEASLIGINVCFAVLAGFVAFGRRKSW